MEKHLLNRVLNRASNKEPIDKIKKYTGFATDKLEEIAKSMGMTFTA